MLQTDLPLREAIQAIEYLELTRAALLAAAWPGAKVNPEWTEKVTVFALADSGQFRDVFPRFAGALYSRSAAGSVIVLHGSPQSWERRFGANGEGKGSVLRHEMAHQLSAYFLSRQPRWLSEGLAEFLETVQLSPDGHTATLGAPHLGSMAVLRSAGSVSIHQVFEWNRLAGYSETEQAGLYASSWLLVHWLFNQNATAFTQFQLRLARGEEPDKAFAAAFPGLDAEKLDPILLQYMQRGSYQEFTAEVPPVDMKMTTRPMSDADVHAGRGLLALVAAQMDKDGSKERFVLGMAEIKEALAKDPGNPSALFWLLPTLPLERRLPMARAAVSAHPETGLAWLLIHKALGADSANDKEREEALRNAVARDPRVSLYANELAWFLVQRHRFEEAMPIARKAARLAAWNSNILDTYAAAAAGLGRCEEAIAAEQRALDFLPERWRGTEDEAKFRKRLAELQATCKPRGDEPTPD